MSNSTGPRQHVSRSMNSSPSFVLSTLPGCGSPCSSCSAAPRSVIARPQASQRVAEELPVGVGERGRVLAARHRALRLRDSIREVRRRDDRASRMPACSRSSASAYSAGGMSRRHGFVVGPQRDHEAVMLVDARLHPRLERSHRALGSASRRASSTLERCARLCATARPGRGRRTAAGARRAGSSCGARSRRRPSGQALRRSTWPQRPHARPPTPASSLDPSPLR